LWRLSRPPAAIVLLILVMTNIFHLGFLANRIDRTDPTWPPTLYRYVAELFDDYRTGNKAMVELLSKLARDPKTRNTEVRIWPPYLVYPAMFYVPELRYCDQLTESKPIDPELREQLPDYLFLERSRPQLLVVPLPSLRQKLGDLLFYHVLRGDDSYQLKTTLAPYWGYTWKPELPGHFFSAPVNNWQRYPGLAVAAKVGSPAAEHPALTPGPNDADALCRLAVALRFMGEAKAAVRHLERAVRVDPDHPVAHHQLGILLAGQEKLGRAARHLQTAIRLDPQNIGAYFHLGETMRKLGRIEQERQQYLAVLRIRPQSALAHYNLGNTAMRQPAWEPSSSIRARSTRPSNITARPSAFRPI